MDKYKYSHIKKYGIGWFTYIKWLIAVKVFKKEICIGISINLGSRTREYIDYEGNYKTCLLK